jgi:cytochrome c-type biogenesis protein CcmF
MIFGITASSLTFIAYIICLAGYYIYNKNKQENFLLLSRVAFYFATLLIFSSAAVLMWGIHTHQFQWQYVFSYSSKDMSTFYLIASFWGGQEGTFLLWLALGSLYGAFIISKKFKDEALVMSFLVLVQAFIAVILIKKNPFTYVWDVFPSHFQTGEIPVDGRGLNPLLQNPWMIIHPPILFVGYSSTSILFAFAMSALVKKNYNNWVHNVFPYAVFVALALGTGIILGGYWAYTTLGWGGYWGWDPVENSSLIPWLISLAVIHSLLVQKKQGGLKKTNIFLALLTFIMVLYGSFLTRSGVLTDFSVHSFSESELNTYLIAFVILFGGIATLSYLYFTRGVTSDKVSGHLVTRESFMLFGILALLLSAIFTFFGTSAPLLTGFFSETASNVTLEYYNLLNAPIAILLGFFIAFSPILSWKKKSGSILKGVSWQIAASVLITVIAYLLGLDDTVPLIIFMFFVLAILVNSEIVYRHLRKNNWSFGGYLAHVGIGFMMIGIITSSVYEKTDKISLPLGTAQSIMGYDMTYMGFRLSGDGKDEAVIRILKDGSEVCEANAKFYWSEFNQAYMRNPSVHNLWLKDLYISPIQVVPVEDSDQGQLVNLVEDEVVYFENYTLKFSGYEMDPHDGEADEIHVMAIINVNGPEGIFVLKPSIEVRGKERNIIHDTIPGSGRKVHLHGVNIKEKSVAIMIDNLVSQQDPSTEKKEMLAIEITEKPLINLLWLGTFIMIAGLVVSLRNRALENRNV